MKKIVIAYWKEHNLIPYFENNYEFDYSAEKLSELIQIILDNNLSIMIRPNVGIDNDILLIYINNGKFVQS